MSSLWLRQVVRRFLSSVAQARTLARVAQLKQINEYPTPAAQYARVLRKYFASLVAALELKEEQRANWFQMAHKLREDLDAEIMKQIKFGLATSK